ncbi:SIR2 family protein [Herminiimonas fonticola]|uniref:SIR2-like protein n=1 Tax=Herminiimonas fonticola TaxID=303380 RepID=A0A4R6GGF0_9BURK|nr:SIR2 family protein [Herminiimonas fonticola]TDN93867.1 SIR2-like protein [Herminiimonas fonticola]
MAGINVIREIRELKSQLSYAKNIGFFMGAGTSCALGLPNIAQLTDAIEGVLTKGQAALFKTIKDDLEANADGRAISIEDILNQVRRIREITGEKKTKNYLGIDGDSAKLLDIEICKKIYELISEKESVANLDVTKTFFAWLNMQNRDYSKEVFTTNYDLIIEKSLEEIQAPYFDGFVGSYEPFFWQESIEKFVKKNDLTQNWIRLWKIHGSLSWFWKINAITKSHKVVRIGKVENINEEPNELVIYPSKEKYDSSRKQPFVVYFDRLKDYLLNGELLFVFSGYSFMDQHINEIVFNCLRQNNRLCVLVFFFNDSEVVNLHSLSSSYLNLNAFGPTKAIINGVLGDWSYAEEDLKQKERPEMFWDKDAKKFILGDFKKLVNFLVANSGKLDEIEAAANAN